MIDMKKRIQSWSSTTYGEMLDARIADGRYKPSPAIEMARRVLERQRLTNKPMNGNSTNGLDKTEREVGKFQYVKVFNKISKVPDWSPVDMVYGTCYMAMQDKYVHKKAVQWGMSDEELISKMCGRALRALPSYLREYDLRNQMESRFPDAEFTQSEALDTELHADLMMKYNGNDYYFWSFVNSPKSIANFQEKFFGHRQGNVPDGYHVTCPFSLDYCTDIDGWKLYDSLDIRSIAKNIENPRCTNYGKAQQLSKSTDMYFQTSKIIDKNAGHERRLNINVTRPIGNHDEMELSFGNR